MGMVREVDGAHYVLVAGRKINTLVVVDYF